jgi:hypothetical protein
MKIVAKAEMFFLAGKCKAAYHILSKINHECKEEDHDIDYLIGHVYSACYNNSNWSKFLASKFFRKILKDDTHTRLKAKTLPSESSS